MNPPSFFALFSLTQFIKKMSPNNHIDRLLHAQFYSCTETPLILKLRDTFIIIPLFVLLLVNQRAKVEKKISHFKHIVII